MTIEVSDVNEPPTIEGRTAVSYPENGASVVETYRGEDPEGDDLVWTLAGRDAGDLEIGRTSGELRFKAPPDHESPIDSNRDNVYEVTVEATDGTNTDQQGVRVTVTDVNEPPQVSGPDSVEFAEDGTDVVADYQATDPEGNRVSWGVAGSDADDFTIGQDSGVLRFAAVPDYEFPVDDDLDNTYQIEVQASDNLLLSHSYGVTVELSNREEAGSLTFRPALPRVGTEFRAELSDPDGGVGGMVWVWERSTGLSPWTAIEGAVTSGYTPQTGDLGHLLRATVTYADVLGGGKTATAVSAGRVDQRSPTNTRPGLPQTETGVRRVTENTGRGHDIGRPVVASDPENDVLTYVLGGADASVFSVGELSGQLRTVSVLDYESR